MTYFLFLPGLMTPYFFFFALSRRLCLIALCSTFKHFHFPNFELNIGVTSLLTDLHYYNPSFAPTLPFFLLCLLCSQLWYSSETQVVTLLHMCLLAALLNISLLVTFATELLLYLGFFLIFGVWCAIFGTLYIDA